jgi:recyclin-1
MGKVWAEKKEIFYQQGKWKALDNFTWVTFTSSIFT